MNTMYTYIRYFLFICISLCYFYLYIYMSKMNRYIFFVYLFENKTLNSFIYSFIHSLSYNFCGCCFSRFWNKGQLTI